MAKNKTTVRFPMNILQPVKKFLLLEVKKLEQRKKGLSSRDPFNDTDRLIDNAASDQDAAEQIGHAQVSAMQKQVDRKIIQLKTALTRIKIGKYGICEKCGRMIDTDRLMVMPEATVCSECASQKEA